MNGALLRLHILIATRLAPRDDERGASLVEYALLVALIAIVCFVAVEFLGESTNSGITDAGSKIRP